MTVSIRSFDRRLLRQSTARVFLSCCLVVGFVSGGYGQSPLLPPAPLLKPHDYSASYDDRSTHLHVAPAAHGITLLFIRTGALPERSIELPHYPGDVTGYAKTPGGNIIITAKAGGSSNLVYILDLRVGQIIDSFLCSEATISPDHRYVVYKKFFPEHGVDEVQSSNFAMIYDADASPAANRDANRGRLIDPLGDVGHLVFPASRTLARSRRDNIPITHTFPSYFFWSPDSKRVLFLDNAYPGDPISAGALHDGNVHASEDVPPSAAIQLVMVELSGAQPKTTRFKIDRCGDPVSSFCYLYLRGVRFGVDGVAVAIGSNVSRSNPFDPSELEPPIPYARFSHF
jgi:hypothetical protein